MTLTKDQITGVLKISGTLDIDAANPLREALLDSFLTRQAVTADLSEVDNCDAAALQVLLAGQRDATSAGKTFNVVAPSAAVTGMAAALGFSIGDSQGLIDAR